MACIHGSIGGSPFILTVGDGTYDIYVGARRWTFEWHHYCGPMPIHRKTGVGIDAPKAFWEAVTLWEQQGKRVEHGVCLYERPEPEQVFHIVGRHYTASRVMAERMRRRFNLPPTCDCAKCTGAASSDGEQETNRK